MTVTVSTKNVDRSKHKIDIINFTKDIFNIEIEELVKVRDKINNEVEEVVNVILNAKGKVVITGVGKSGIIGKKIAATFASTGTYAVFMNSAEGLHGDLGMIHPDDVVIAISNSGNSSEVIEIIPSIKNIGATLIAMTGNLSSKLANEADYVIDIGVEKEACPMNIAPTCSTTATLVMGDALASALIKLRNFQLENFALYHPGGSLGKKLLTKIEDVMHTDFGSVHKDTKVDEVVLTMTKKNLGAVCVIENEHMIGIITEGDIRRALSQKEKFFELQAEDIMTENFISISKEKKAVEALELMEKRDSQISIIPVLENKKVIGMVRIHDILSFK